VTANGYLRQVGYEIKQDNLPHEHLRCGAFSVGDRIKM